LEFFKKKGKFRYRLLDSAAVVIGIGHRKKTKIGHRKEKKRKVPPPQKRQSSLRLEFFFKKKKTQVPPPRKRQSGDWNWP
jgi:hypothetical protein